MNSTIFVSTPITGFNSSQEFLLFKEYALVVIDRLKKLGYTVFNEFEHISDENDFDSPSKSVDEDFKIIEKTEIFILIHPRKMQTSTLIELGYACACRKKIVIISEYNDLPFLAKGLSNSLINACLLDYNNDITVTLDSLTKVLPPVNIVL